MALKQTMEAYELLDRSDVSGDMVSNVLRTRGLSDIEVRRIDGARGHTDFVRVVVPGGGTGRTLGIIGRLGGVGARPARIGIVSDADGAIVALACALKLADMISVGDQLPGQVVIATHICPAAPIIPHQPVPLMDSPVEMSIMNQHEVDPRMDAILSVDATKANNIMNVRGIAITPTVKEGYVLRVSPGLAELLASVSGRSPHVLPITTQDITPYGNGLYHLNSIVQPSIATRAPVVGVATICESAVPGCATGANQPIDLECAVRFCIEVAKDFTAGRLDFFDLAEWDRIIALYGSLERLQANPGTARIV